jgi:hypothetical protein
MPSLTGPIGHWGPMIDLKVMQTPHHAESLKALNRPVAQPSTCRALIDTGASTSVLDFRLVRSLDLLFRDTVIVHTPSTGSRREYRDTYDVYFVIGEQTDKPLTGSLTIVVSELAEQNFYALIGRDILSRCVLTYDGPRGRYELSW